MTDPDAALRTLAAWAPAFAGGIVIGRWQGGETDQAGVIHLPWYELSEEAQRFVSEMVAADLVRPMDWRAWAASPGARRLIEEPAEIAHATPDELAALLTTIIRGERFGDGQIEGAYERGTLLAIAERAAALLAGAPPER